MLAVKKFIHTVIREAFTICSKLSKHAADASTIRYATLTIG
jgi:hypothetical protein